MERTLIKSTPEMAGVTVKLQGWVENIREMGKITFIDLRDRTGNVQCVGYKMLNDLTIESVVEITGEVKKRPERMINPDQQTGTIEIDVKEYKILNKAAALPIPVEGEGYDVKEDARMRYRYLDLRRKRVNKNMRLRSQLAKEIRNHLYENDFVEIETPLLTKATMEGSRDFIIPSRMQPGKFYALPQSPQQYKQLLMTAGFERYFQLARCVRDENLRADRGFEHTQVDMELSFVKREDVMAIIEEMVKKVIKKLGGVLKDEVFPVVDYKDAIQKYGADKFDIRTPEEKEKGVLAFAWVINFPFFKQVDKEDAAEVRDGKSGWTFTHNPFSMPVDEHIDWHMKGENVDQIITTQYDLVCNGYEVGGGSIRAHLPELLRATYKIMGYTEEEIQKSVGHMLEAFELGTPPHGGIALGLDRLAMLLSGEESLKEVIAFPMTYNGKISVMDAPAPATEEQLKELGIKLI